MRGCRKRTKQSCAALAEVTVYTMIKNTNREFKEDWTSSSVSDIHVAIRFTMGADWSTTLSHSNFSFLIQSLSELLIIRWTSRHDQKKSLMSFFIFCPTLWIKQSNGDLSELRSRTFSRFPPV